MITLYTIGFTKKSAEDFFELLKKHHVKNIIDVRISNSSQLAGFAKGNDLIYFLKQICGIGYRHIVDFAPTKELLGDYRSGYLEKLAVLHDDVFVGDGGDSTGYLRSGGIGRRAWPRAFFAYHASDSQTDFCRHYFGMPGHQYV